MSDQAKNDWPEEIGFSMAPFGYVTHAKKTEFSSTGVTYRCNEYDHNQFCEFKVSVDPRDMVLEFVKQIMRWHMDQSH